MNDDTKQVIQYPKVVQYLVIVPVAALAMAAFTLAQGASSLRAACFGAFSALVGLGAAQLFPRGYLFLTPHLARPERRTVCWLILAGYATAFVTILVATP